ncbi:family 20 glycosylhydrolase [Polycladomyces sp. WAk]|uniref:Family 20 glycosylhydrolase n=1 Tax=Polycladomyces zharkentensis TaxID=2807616 RepID=A0ABS2WGW1_9BACL|nr:family 20 glycosylhydrolase [Polycladomyces sp. WAk]MBN2908675.1 family 20 glycosylhydrolase [Polycladomyces sp. WAk]
MKTLRLLPEPKRIRLRAGKFVPDASQPPAVSLDTACEERLMRKVRGLSDTVRVEAVPGFSLVWGNPEPITEEERPRHPDGYALSVDKGGIRLIAPTARGLYYGWLTLQQLREEDDGFPACLIQDEPCVSLRGIHLDFKAGVPTMAYLEETIIELSRYKINLLLVEYEDRVPWGDEGWRHPHALTLTELERLQQVAHDHFVEVMPLQQTFGHLHYILRHDRWARFRELPDQIGDLCPSHPEAVAYVAKLVEQMAAAHPRSRHIHLGADETFHLHACPRCRERWGESGRETNYVHHVNRMAELVRRHGKIPVIWDDMLRGMSDRSLDQLSRDICLMVWCYYTGDRIHRQIDRHVERYRTFGFHLFGAGCIQGADEHAFHLPNYRSRADNLADWARRLARGSWEGAVGTAWARYTSVHPPTEPFPVIWYGALLAAECFWTGQPPELTKVDDFVSRRLFGTATTIPFHRINPGHYANGLYDDPEAMEVLVSQAVRRRREAEMYRLMAKLRHLQLWTRHALEHGYRIDRGWSTRTETAIVCGYVKEALRMADEWEQEALPVFTSFYRRQDAEEWLASRLDPIRRQAGDALKRWQGDGA